MADPDNYAIKHIRRFEQMKAKRSSLNGELQEVVDLVRPSAGNFITDNNTPNQPRGSQGKLYDDTAIYANHLFASGYMAMTVRPDELWMALKAPDDKLNARDDVRLWLWQVNSAMYDVFNSPKLGFYPAAHTYGLELGSFGTVVTGQFLSKKKTIDFNTRFLGECYIERDDDGETSTVAREFRVAASGFEQRYGFVPDLVAKSLAAGRVDDMFTVIHMVTTREISDRITGSQTPSNKPFTHDYFLYQTKETLSRGGHDEFPWQVSLWTQYAGDDYGRGCGLEALPSIRMLNQMAKDNIKVGNIAAEPAWQVPDDGFMLPFRYGPRAINYYRAGQPDDRAYPLRTDYNGVPFAVELEQRRAKMVERMFYADIMLSVMNKTKEMTLGEVQQVVEEQARVMVPYVLRGQKEWMAPMCDRVFSLLVKLGKIPPPPEVLKNQEMLVEFYSPITQAQKSVYAVRLQRAFNIITPMASIDQTILDNINFDRTTRWLLGDVFGIPAPVMNSTTEIDQIRLSRARASQEESMKQDAVAAANSYSTIAKGQAALTNAGA